jgi:plastocyanin
MKRLLTAAIPLILAVGLAACSSASGSQAQGTVGTPVPGGAQVVAKDIHFQQTSLTVKAGTAFDLQFVNQDSAPHNVAIYTDASASSKVFAGDIIQAGETHYQVPALTAGTYFFRCDVHPDMKGEIVAN